MYQVKEVENQLYANRIRKNVARVMDERGMPGHLGLPSMTKVGLYKFISCGSDITITRLQQIADDLGVSIFELMANA